MNVTPQQLLSQLPAYQGESIPIKEDQVVPDIIREIMDAHQAFTEYYDRISLYFDAGDTKEICNNIYRFLKKNIHYKEEDDSHQTTAIPTHILTTKQGDCKHFASMAGGILDSLNRYGRNINWCYRFASYDITSDVPKHVFVVVNPGGNELWIDPTPDANNEIPVFILDKKVKKNPMALRRIISGAKTLDTIATGADILSSVTTLISNIFGNIVIGDQVPKYPIKSKATYEKILGDINNLFPHDPTTVAEAQADQARALQYAQEAYAKGGNVNTTYGMIYDEVAETLENFINLKTGLPPAFTPSPNATPTLPGHANNVILPPPPAEPSKKPNLLLIGGAVGLGILLMQNRKVSRAKSENTLLLIGLGIGAIYLLTKKKPETNTDLPPSEEPGNQEPVEQDNQEANEDYYVDEPLQPATVKPIFLEDDPETMVSMMELKDEYV